MSASRPPLFAVTAIFPLDDTAGRFWKRWNDSNVGDCPPWSRWRTRRWPSFPGSLICRSTPVSLAWNQQKRSSESAPAEGIARGPRW